MAITSYAPKVASPRIWRRDGAPSFWAYLDAPGRTFAGDSGDIPDLAGNLRAGVRAAGCTWATGPRGPELACDGTGDGLSFATPGWGPYRTYRLDFRADSLANAYTGLIGDYNPTGPVGATFYLKSDGKFALYVDGAGDGDGAGSLVVTAGSYHTAHVSIGPGRAFWAIDGVVDYSAPTAPAVPSAAYGPTLRVGYDDFAGRRLAGRIGGVAAWPRPLSPAEVALDFADPDRRLRRPTRAATFARPSAVSWCVGDDGTTSPGYFEA